MTSIRPAILADIPAILKLEQACSGAAHWDEQEYSRILRGNTAAERVVLVAEQQSPQPQKKAHPPSVVSRHEHQLPMPIPNVSKLETRGSELAGFIVARIVGSDWEIENLAVCAAARREHLGTRLVLEILQLARSRGATSVWLEVRQSNSAARALYEGCGFVQTGSRADYYRDPAEDAVLYRHQLLELFSKPIEGV